MELNFNVTDQSLILTTDIRDLVITSDSINNVQCKFTFDNTWDGYLKRVYIKNSSYNILKPTLLGSDNKCTIPWECLSHTGVITCAVVGSKFDDGQLISRLTTNTVTMLLQRDEAILQSTFEPTGTEFEQLLATLLDYSDVLISLDTDIKDIQEYVDGIVLDFDSYVEAVEAAVEAAAQSADDAAAAVDVAVEKASEAASSASTANQAAQNAILAVEAAQSAAEDAARAAQDAEQDVFIAKYDQTSFSEIKAAHLAHSIVILITGTNVAYLNRIVSNGSINLQCAEFTTGYGTKYKVNSSDVWSTAYSYFTPLYITKGIAPKEIYRSWVAQRPVLLDVTEDSNLAVLTSLQGVSETDFTAHFVAVSYSNSDNVDVIHVYTRVYQQYGEDAWYHKTYNLPIKNDIVVLEKQSLALSPDTTGLITFSNTDITQAGIDDLLEWAIISCTQRNDTSGYVYERTAFVVSSDHVYPCVTITNSSAITVEVYNDYATTMSIIAKVVLMRVGTSS